MDDDGRLNDANLEDELREVVRALLAEIQPALELAA